MTTSLLSHTDFTYDPKTKTFTAEISSLSLLFGKLTDSINLRGREKTVLFLFESTHVNDEEEVEYWNYVGETSDDRFYLRIYND
jgi:hypothetical protein